MAPLTALLCAFLLAVAPATRAEEPVRIFAAASLATALTDAAALWTRNGHPAPLLAFGGSSGLARQVVAGAPADLFISADTNWMDHVAQRGRILPASRAEWLGNSLVLVVPQGRRFKVELHRGFDLAAAFNGRLCTGEPGVVPVGIYAQQALAHYGWWPALQGRIVGTEDVRSALAFVARGECPLGIVYATDAMGTAGVEVLATFPADSHSRITYSFALLTGARPAAAAFLRFLRDSPAAAAVFRRHGFLRLDR